MRTRRVRICTLCAVGGSVSHDYVFYCPKKQSRQEFVGAAPTTFLKGIIHSTEKRNKRVFQVAEYLLMTLIIYKVFVDLA